MFSIFAIYRFFLLWLSIARFSICSSFIRNKKEESNNAFIKRNRTLLIVVNRGLCRFEVCLSLKSLRRTKWITIFWRLFFQSRFYDDCKLGIQRSNRNDNKRKKSAKFIIPFKKRKKNNIFFLKCVISN